MLDTNAFMQTLHDFFSPCLGEWLNYACIFLAYFNALAQLFYLAVTIFDKRVVGIKEIGMSMVWVPVLVVVVLGGIYYKNLHQTAGFFLALLFLVTNILILLFRYFRRRKKLKRTRS